MIRPVTFLVDRPRRVRPPFVLAEVALVLAVPVLAFLGLSTLLESRAGTFVEEPGPTDPGYRALVEPTPVTALVEIVDRRLTGIAVVTQPSGELGGAVLLVPGELEVEGVRLGSLAVEEAVGLLETELALEIGTVEVIEERRWPDILGGAEFEIQNPDPVAAPGDAADDQAAAPDAETDGEDLRQVLFDVGPVVVDGSTLGLLLGAPGANDDPRSLLFRRELIWNAMLEADLLGADPMADLLNGISAGQQQVAVLPTRTIGSGLVIDAEPAELQVRQFVPFPSGAQPGDRLRLRVLDRVGGLDLLAVASRLGSLGYEVVEIGNVATFAQTPSENLIVVPLGIEDDRVNDLAVVMAADTMVSDEIDPGLDGLVTLLVAG